MPVLSEIANNIKNELSQDQMQEMDYMFSLLDGWNGEMEEDSIAATVYSFALLAINKSFYHAYEKDPEQRANMIDGYLQSTFTEHLFKEILEKGDVSPLNRVCKDAYPEYKGTEHCAYNIARSFADTKNFLETNVSSASEDWLWRNVHFNSYVNLPFSRTPLRFLFHRNVPTGGNANTMHSSKYSLKKNYNATSFESSQSSNYKQIIQLDPDPKKERNLWSIETGMNGNPFQGNYF